MSSLQGKIAIVTGAGSGIGEATAKRLAADGASVVLTGRRREKLDAVAATLDPANVLVAAGDIAVRADVEAMVAATIAKFGKLDILVNNAGTAIFGPFLDTPDDAWQALMRTNVDGVIYASRAALPHLLETRGCIVNVSSVSGIRGDWGGSFYNASKGAVSNLTRALALEFGSRGVRINAVAPSLTESEMSASLTDRPEVIRAVANRMPLGRAAKGSEIASVIAFLASDDAGFINGAVVPVDGGVTASNGQPNFGAI